MHPFWKISLVWLFSPVPGCGRVPTCVILPHRAWWAPGAATRAAGPIQAHWHRLPESSEHGREGVCLYGSVGCANAGGVLGSRTVTLSGTRPRKAPRTRLGDFFWLLGETNGPELPGCAMRREPTASFHPHSGLRTPRCPCCHHFYSLDGPPSSSTFGGNSASGFQAIRLCCRVVPGAVLSLALTLTASFFFGLIFFTTLFCPYTHLLTLSSRILLNIRLFACPF